MLFLGVGYQSAVPATTPFKEVPADLDATGQVDSVLVRQLSGGKEDGLILSVLLNTEEKEKTVLSLQNVLFDDLHILPRTPQSHVALVTSFPPATQDVWIFHIQDGTPVVLLHEEADAGIVFVDDTVVLKNKKYKDPMNGGFDIVETVYSWNTEEMMYNNQ